MEQAGGHHEADGEGDGIGRFRQLRAVSVAMEDGEDSDQYCCDPERGTCRECDHGTEYDGRNGDSDLDARNRNTR